MFDPDQLIDRHGSGSSKWSRYPADVLPMWVADMDFAVEPRILQALSQRLEHPFLGYSVPTDALRETVVAHLWRCFGWRVQPEELVFLPGVEPGFNMALRAFLQPGDGVAVQVPNYTPVLKAAGFHGLRRLDLALLEQGGQGYASDPVQQQQVLSDARALLFCNPQNPTGKVYERDELIRLAQDCERHDVLIISDEIHAEVLYDGRRHIPIASLDASVARRTITLMSASKAYNIAGTKAAFAVIGDAAVRERFNAARAGMVDSVNALGLVALEAALRHGESWFEQVRQYLQANRDWLGQAVATRLPGVRLIPAQGTFLAWLDMRDSGLARPQPHLLQHGRVALSDGADFGPGYEGFARLNFGCPRALLDEGLARIERALAQRP